MSLLPKRFDPLDRADAEGRFLDLVGEGISHALENRSKVLPDGHNRLEHLVEVAIGVQVGKIVRRDDLTTAMEDASDFPTAEPLDEVACGLPS